MVLYQSKVGCTTLPCILQNYPADWLNHRVRADPRATCSLHKGCTSKAREKEQSQAKKKGKTTTTKNRQGKREHKQLYLRTSCRKTTLRRKADADVRTLTRSNLSCRFLAHHQHLLLQFAELKYSIKNLNARMSDSAWAYRVCRNPVKLSH